MEQFFMPSYRNSMKWDSSFHTMRFLHFGDNKNEPIKTATHATVTGLTKYLECRAKTVYG